MRKKRKLRKMCLPVWKGLSVEGVGGEKKRFPPDEFHKCVSQNLKSSDTGTMGIKTIILQ